MTTWTLEQVRQVKGLRVRLEVDVATADRSGAKAAIASKMARIMIHHAHSFAVELHEADLEVRWSQSEDRPWVEAAEMRWNPSTTEVEMRGGDTDGQRVMIQRVGEPLHVAVHEPIDWSAPPTAPVPTPDPMTYELAGWREDERVWVYAVR